ncbi:hypothetical protein [uncultured Microscilla sp.]|uniref:hypothetical protein n=1 Tax=uncultured Microscilla sp. TaxID=432653 RepID=UPI0026351088|nr:hypothetical protein [uncultured Microscilla sp.]
MDNLCVAFREGEKETYWADLEDIDTDKQQGFEYKEVIISSDPTSASNHAAKLTSAEPLGMLRNLEVSKGDVVKVKGYYAGSDPQQRGELGAYLKTSEWSRKEWRNFYRKHAFLTEPWLEYYAQQRRQQPKCERAKRLFEVSVLYTRRYSGGGFFADQTFAGGRWAMASVRA